MLQEISSNMYSYLFKATTEQWSVAVPPFLHIWLCWRCSSWTKTCQVYDWKVV